MKYTEIQSDRMESMPLPQLIALALEHAEFWLGEDIYPDDMDDLERAEVARLRGLQHQATFTPEEVVFITHRVCWMAEMNAVSQHQQHTERVAAYQNGLFK